MESTMPDEVTQESLLAELDRLGERVERAAALITELRRERARLREAVARLEQERGRLLAAGQAHDPEELIAALGELRTRAAGYQRMVEERAVVARRLGTLIDKVDSLGGAS
jgi:chromosome segregation ATPase